MGKPPQRPKVQLPSPLQQVHFTRPLSQPPPEMGLVRDPAFWKRFSTAIHQADGSDGGSASSADEKDQWLLQQHKEKRRCRVLCVVITMIVVMIIVAAAVCGWYFTKAVK